MAGLLLNCETVSVNLSHQENKKCGSSSESSDPVFTCGVSLELLKIAALFPSTFAFCRGEKMGLLTNRVERSEIKPGDHIYTYRAVFAYSHHGIFVGGSKVVHFTWVDGSSDAADEISGLSSSCPFFPDCGFRLPNSGVVLSCLNCFLRNGSLYNFEYGVSSSVFLSKVRGGTCTTAVSDPPEMVIHRAMHLLQNGFGNYDVFQNNCEDFALYCKTGLLTLDRLGVGRSGQASSVVGAPLAALLSSPLKLLIPSPVGVATVTAGMYCMSRYATDIGVRSDVIKVAVEDLAVNLGWGSSNEGAIVEHDDSNNRIHSSFSTLEELVPNLMQASLRGFLRNSGVCGTSKIRMIKFKCYLSRKDISMTHSDS
ncbi:protein LEAD-SENSITIVE 1 isoform X1 [Capsicum annuum]|uniref:protein LEAD-SENSITIVE 1 isoform X1 n=2 Tax=Capsicum annuum TaxID=4072 RepID=UPI001FB0F3AF|nr:protein LEAD-SENSITIVE 1 isoform X1 [Capsicum annuum]